MADRLLLKDIELWMHIGVPDLERETEQCLRISLTFETDTRRAAGADDPSFSVDYTTIPDDIRRIAEQPCRTIERLAERIAVYALELPNVDAVEVTVAKTPFPATGEVSLSIRRP